MITLHKYTPKRKLSKAMIETNQYGVTGLRIIATDPDYKFNEVIVRVGTPQAPTHMLTISREMVEKMYQHFQDHDKNHFNPPRSKA